MNTISASGHAALWKKYGLNQLPSAEKVKVETPHSSPSRTIDSCQVPCSPLLPRASRPEWLASAAHRDTPKSIEMEPLEEHHESSSSPVITLEECLREKTNIDRVLAERAKLGPFLIESTERPIVDNMTVFQESAEAIRSQAHGKPKSHLYDNIETIKKEHRCYGLNHMDVIAIRLYTTAMAFVVNEALRNYSLHHMPIPTAFLPYIYALLNSLAKIDRDREMNEAYCSFEFEPREVARYIPLLDEVQRDAIQSIIDTHQPGAYVMYPAFTSSSERDLAKRLWSYGFEYRFEIKARTAISIQDFSINPNEFEAVFPPGTIFQLLERDGRYFVMEEVVLQKLKDRRAALPC